MMQSKYRSRYLVTNKDKNEIKTFLKMKNANLKKLSYC